MSICMDCKKPTGLCQCGPSDEYCALARTEYHKIQSIFKRDPANKHRTFLTGEWTIPEFGYLAFAQWDWTEKIDGTNIRVLFDFGRVHFGGRTNNAQIPTILLTRLMDLFPAEKMETLDLEGMTLYGEGYGAKIQKGGGNYIPNGVDFILFDVKCGKWWLKREDVEDIASKLGIKAVPIVGRGTLHEAIHKVQNHPLPSKIGSAQAEGLVMRPAVELCTRGGDRIITKVKVKDFK